MFVQTLSLKLGPFIGSIGAHARNSLSEHPTSQEVIKHLHPQAVTYTGYSRQQRPAAGLMRGLYSLSPQSIAHVDKATGKKTWMKSSTV